MVKLWGEVSFLLHFWNWDRTNVLHKWSQLGSAVQDGKKGFKKIPKINKRVYPVIWDLRVALFPKDKDLAKPSWTLWKWSYLLFRSYSSTYRTLNSFVWKIFSTSSDLISIIFCEAMSFTSILRLIYVVDHPVCSSLEQ